MRDFFDNFLRYHPMIKEMQAVTKMHDVIKWLMPRVEDFKRSFKFTLGDRIIDLSLDVLMLLVAAQYTRKKLDLLSEANMKLEQLRHLLRLCKEMELLSIRRYEYISREINEVGKYIGGWVKQQQKRG